jgi:putative transposase
LKYNVDILNYIITSNHIHLLLWSAKSHEISSAIQYVHGRTAQEYNIIKKREGSFWKDRYHLTLIEKGFHLSRCLFYIDINMLRAGVVAHPSKWKHSGYHEITGRKKRYRVINKKKLLSCLEMKDYNSFLIWYKRTLDNELKINYYVRNSVWTESAAVGNDDFLKSVSKKYPSRKKKILYCSEKSIVKP